jgi:hypothetical protein
MEIVKVTQRGQGNVTLTIPTAIYRRLFKDVDYMTVEATPTGLLYKPLTPVKEKS